MTSKERKKCTGAGDPPPCGKRKAISKFYRRPDGRINPRCEDCEKARRRLRKTERLAS